MTALFISPTYLKKKSIIDGHTDDDKLVQFIETAQDIHVQNYLGTNLYNRLQALVIATELDAPGNELYSTLLKTYVKPMLAWYAQAEYIPFSAYTVANGGVFRHRSDASDAVPYEEIAGLATRAQDKASFYTNRLIEYMNTNGSKYPEYNSSTDDMYPDKEVNNFGWVV